MSVKIIADSTCDLTKELLEKYDISIIPLHIVLGEKEYRDGSEISPDEIYQWSDTNKEAPKTSAISISDAMEIYEACAKTHDEIVCFSISGQMSTTVNVMRMAAEELELEDRIHIIDSANLSTGGGLLVIEAAIMAQEGKSASEIVDAIEVLKPQVRATFIVDTLTFLHRGGRCSGVAALAGGALKLHPKIVVENGAMKPDKKYRGKMNSAIMTYVKDLEEQIKNAKTDRVFLTHSGCDEELLQSIYDYVKELNIFKEIHIARAGGVISSHCGPGTFGLLFIENI